MSIPVAKNKSVHLGLLNDSNFDMTTPLKPKEEFVTYLVSKFTDLGCSFCDAKKSAWIAVDLLIDWNNNSNQPYEEYKMKDTYLLEVRDML